MTALEVVPAGRYQNVYLGDAMVASFDQETGEFVVYDPHDPDSEEPVYIVRPEVGRMMIGKERGGIKRQYCARCNRVVMMIYDHGERMYMCPECDIE